VLGGAIAAGVIVVGSIGAAIGAGGDDKDPVAASPTAEASVATPPPSTAPSDAPVVAPVEPVEPVADAVVFKAETNGHLDDMLKDLGDIEVTVSEGGFWRLYSNSVELSFNYGQLSALDVPTNVAVTWPAALAALDTGISALDDAIATDDEGTILGAVQALRGQVEAARAVADTAI
jgi:hypothetical protein